MYRVENLTNSSRQKQVLVLPDQSKIEISIYFIPMQYGWFITSLVYKDFILNNIRISNSPNMLNQFRNQIPFGMACISTQNREPSLQDDFATDVAQLFILTPEEVDAYTAFLTGEISV